MSKTEILTELPKLTPEERQEVREVLAEIDGTDWLDDGELTHKEQEAPKRRRHPITMENSPEETMKRMASFPERAAKFRERLRALREANSR